MKKSEFNALFREYAKNNLSPNEKERNFVSAIYDSFKSVLGEKNCLQIGSYPRFTAIRPIHDLDILYIAGEWSGSMPDPTEVLKNLQNQITSGYKNSTKYQTKISLQTHSITILFLNGQEEIFSVDIVPGYSFAQNEFGSDMFLVPEILTRSFRGRANFYQELAKGSRVMDWIKSDPSGYIKIATQINEKNGDFRKSVKFIKAWRASCKEYSDDFKLKSFHIEQIITRYFSQNPSAEIFDAVFSFFCELPNFIDHPQIVDRADANRKIDDYLEQLTTGERGLILEARDHFLIALEGFSEESKVADLIKVGFRTRKGDTEKYLFDYGIPTLLETRINLKISAKVLPRQGGFTVRFLDAAGLIEIDRRIEFRVRGNWPDADLFKWKVKNDDNSPEPRGEITDYHTLRDPEYSKYNGNHFVECYAIKDGVCIARARQNVVLKSRF